MLGLGLAARGDHHGIALDTDNSFRDGLLEFPVAVGLVVAGVVMGREIVGPLVAEREIAQWAAVVELAVVELVVVAGVLVCARQRLQPLDLLLIFLVGIPGFLG